MSLDHLNSKQVIMLSSYNILFLFLELDFKKKLFRWLAHQWQKFQKRTIVFCIVSFPKR